MKSRKSKTQLKSLDVTGRWLCRPIAHTLPLLERKYLINLNLLVSPIPFWKLYDKGMRYETLSQIPAQDFQRKCHATLKPPLSTKEDNPEDYGTY